MRKKQASDKKDSLTRKIEKLYRNYGISTENIADDELERLKDMYKRKGQSIDKDLKESEKYKERFEDDTI